MYERMIMIMMMIITIIDQCACLKKYITNPKTKRNNNPIQQSSIDHWERSRHTLYIIIEPKTNRKMCEKGTIYIEEKTRYFSIAINNEPEKNYCKKNRTKKNFLDPGVFK